MADIEKIKKGLECCKESTEDDPFQKCGECPYEEISIFVQDCRAVLSSDALELIKIQQMDIESLKNTIKSMANGI